MSDHDGASAYPPDRLRGANPAARAWAVVRACTMDGYCVVTTEAWIDSPARYDADEIVTRGLTRPEADAHAYVLNTAHGGGPGAEWWEA